MRTAHDETRFAARLGLAALLGSLTGCDDLPDEPMADDFECAASTEQQRRTHPTPIFLMFPDGLTPAPNDGHCRRNPVPPPFACPFESGSQRDCALEILGYLQRWYRPFNVYFTLEQPTAGPFDTIVVTNEPSWCGNADFHGESPSKCTRLENKVAFALACDGSAKDCAVTIAHEHGHLVGLAHERNDREIMFRKRCDQCDGFMNAVIAVPGNECKRSEQNSYKSMCLGLGPRSHVAAPAAAVECIDSGRVAQPDLDLGAENSVLAGGAIPVSARDECGVRGVALMDSNGRKLHEDLRPPYELEAPGNEGEREVIVSVEDNDGNVATRQVAVNVVPRSCPRLPCRVGEPP